MDIGLYLYEANSWCFITMWCQKGLSGVVRSDTTFVECNWGWESSSGRRTMNKRQHSAAEYRFPKNRHFAPPFLAKRDRRGKRAGLFFNRDSCMSFLSCIEFTLSPPITAKFKMVNVTFDKAETTNCQERNNVILQEQRYHGPRTELIIKPLLLCFCSFNPPK